MADPPRADLPSCPADPAKKRKRRLRIALAALALLIVSAAAAAPIGSRIARGQLESRIEEMLAVELELESLALDLSGSLGLSGLTIVDLDQRPLLSLERLDANVGVLGALFGSLDVEAHMRGLELHVYVDERGQLREPKLVREEWKRARAEAAAQDDEPAGGVPDIKLLFDLEDARVVVHTPEGETRLEGIALSLERPEGDGPLAFELGANLYGPDGAGGVLRSTGTLSAPTEEGALPIGSVESILEELQLAALAPILRSYSEIESLSGQLNGSARIEFKDSEHGVASFGLSALDVASQGPWSPEEIGRAHV